MNMATVRPGVVSVILVNYRGTDDTLTAIEQLEGLDWPSHRLEIVVVENASGDDSAERLRALGDRILLVESTENRGFAGGCNLGVARSSGEFIAFLNNDAKPGPRWISAAVARLSSSSRIGAVATKVLDWEGERIDFIDAALTWYGMGYKPGTGEGYTHDALQAGADVLFGTGSSMFVRREVFDALEGFDERYFMFFEDVDFGWRLNLRGWRFVYEPDSVAFHKHHGSMGSFGQWKENYLLERNALFTLYKNASDQMLSSTLPAALALAVRRGIARTDLDSTELDIRRRDDDSQTTRAVPKIALAPVFAIDQFVEHLDTLRESRDAIRSTAIVSDQHMQRLFRQTDMPGATERAYLDGYVKVTNAFDLELAAPAQRVLVVTGDPIGVRLAGPGIRAWSMAEALAADNEVRLVSLTKMDAESPRFDTAHVAIGDQRGMARQVAWADTIVFQGLAMALYDSIASTDKVIVADVYDPMHLEQLEQARSDDMQQWTRGVRDATDVLNAQLARADFLVCASERQRHFYLGQLAALGRVMPTAYNEDSDLRNVIDVVPFGLSEQPPVHEREVLRGVRPGFDADDRILIWAGGLYDWFDPASLIRAVAALAETRPNVRLFFLGTRNPNPGVPEMPVVADSRALARSLGVLDRNVFLNDSWVEFADRQNYLLEADAGVSTHFAHIETTFSFRTRILDYLWAGLPIVTTEGDSFAELVRDEGLGIVVPSGDVNALAAALEKVLFDEEFARQASESIARVRERFYWSTALAPLVQFVSQAAPALDRLDSVRGRSKAELGRPAKARRRYGIRHDLERTRHYLSTEGPLVVARKIGVRVRSRLRR